MVLYCPKLSASVNRELLRLLVALVPCLGQRRFVSRFDQSASIEKWLALLSGSSGSFSFQCSSLRPHQLIAESNMTPKYGKRHKLILV